MREWHSLGIREIAAALVVSFRITGMLSLVPSPHFDEECYCPERVLDLVRSPCHDRTYISESQHCYNTHLQMSLYNYCCVFLWGFFMVVENSLHQDLCEDDLCLYAFTVSIQIS